MFDAAVAYVRRDWLVWSSYRLHAAMHVVGVCVLVALVASIGDAIGASTVDVMGNDQDYAAFVLAGLAFTDPFFAGLTSPPKAIREGQVSGTLEPVLLTPSSAMALTLGSSSFAFIQAVLRSVLIVSVTIVALGHWGDANFVALLLVAVPAWTGFLALGLLAAAFTVVVKQGDPVVVAYAGLSAMVGGAIVPVGDLPGWLQGIGAVLPLTHALDGVRIALEGGSVSAVAPNAVPLAVLAAVALPIGVAALRWAFRFAKQEGSLVHY